MGPGGAWPRGGGEIGTLEGGKLVPGEAAGPVSLEGELLVCALEGVRFGELEGDGVA